MKITLYLSQNKQREVEIGHALSEGFKKHGDEVETLPTEGYVQPKGDTQLAVMVGVKGRSRQIFDDHRRAARHTILVDKSYFGRGDYYRLSMDGFQPNYAHEKERPLDRFERLKVSLQPKRSKGKHAIYAGSSQKYCDWHGLGDASDFAFGVCHAVNKQMHSAMPVYYRPKPSWAAGHPEEVKLMPHTIFSGPNETLAQRLPNCHALVTHGSNAAIEAIAAGVPAILISKEGASAAWPLAEESLENGFSDPFFPDETLRRQIFANLAWCQFTLDEMHSGFAWETLIPWTAKRLATLGDMSPADATVELYKMMHRGPKMFRGNSMKGHIEAIAALVEKYQPKTLLDYGSGKGAQYDELRLHERWGGIKPTCYDPGYPPLATKPSGTFDGVLCTDVAEHIPEESLDDFLRDVIGYGTKFAFFCIFTEPSRKFLPDGRNCHVTVRPPGWWVDRIKTVAGGDLVSEYMVTKPLPGGAFEDFRHYVIRADGKDVVVTFRGSD